MDRKAVLWGIDRSAGAIGLGFALLLISLAGMLLPGNRPPMLRFGERAERPLVVAVVAPVTATPTPFQPAAPTVTPTPEKPGLVARSWPPAGIRPSAGPLPSPEAARRASGDQADGRFLVPLSPAPTLAPPPDPLPPDRIAIPAIGLDAPVLPASYLLVAYQGQLFQQWEAPYGYAAGWQTSSAPLGVAGNTVLNGHHNTWGAVFAGLVNLSAGDLIQVYSGETRLDYVVSNTMVLPEAGMPLSARLENARWLQTSDDERLTLVTCWPAWTNTHRLIIVARPVAPAE